MSSVGTSIKSPLASPFPVDAASVPSLHASIWRSSILANDSIPPPMWHTAGGTPSGSLPTLMKLAPSVFGVIIIESLPSQPPMVPNSSPMKRMSAASMPRGFAICSIRYSTESALSVSPSSTCFTSLVSLPSSPTSSEQRPTRSITDRIPSSPAAFRRSSVSSSSSPILSFGGSSHPGTGMMSSLRLFIRLEMIRVSSPCSAASMRCAILTASSIISFSARVASRAQSRMGRPPKSKPYTSDPLFTQAIRFVLTFGLRREKNCLSRLAKFVPVTAASHMPLPSNTSARHSRWSTEPEREATAVPSQSKTSILYRRDSNRLRL